jgi:hypothetical protein
MHLGRPRTFVRVMSLWSTARSWNLLKGEVFVIPGNVRIYMYICNIQVIILYSKNIVIKNNDGLKEATE